MPELPEVETVVADLNRALPGRQLRGLRCAWPNQMPLNRPEEAAQRVAGQKVSEVSRRGKYILMELSRDWIIIHLKMTGRIEIVPSGAEANPHAHVAFDLDAGDTMRFHDPRKFGRVYVLPSPEPVIGNLGVEPLSEAFTPGWLALALADRRRRIKPLLLDQTFVAGLGNIYVDESLWRAQLHPLLPAAEVGPDQSQDLHEGIRAVLEEAIAARGTTFTSPGYRDLEGREGQMAGRLKVFGRAGEPCPRCGATIERIVVEQRGTHHCPRCQPAP